MRTSERAQRSATICDALRDLDEVTHAERVLAYQPMGSEVDVAAFVAWCRAAGKDVRVPEDEIAPDWADVVIVPGLAFTRDGQRCGQGAGWYDRFLPGRRTDCVTVGVGFRTQIVESLPTSELDVVLDRIVTD